MATNDGEDSVVLTRDDQESFNLLQSNTYDKLRTLNPPSRGSMEKLENYVADVAAYVSEHETTRKGSKHTHRFSQAVQQALVERGSFQELSDGSAVIAILSSGLGDDHERDEVSFLEASGATADLTLILINYLRCWESSLTQPDTEVTKRLAAEYLLPLVDYFPWYIKHKDDYAAASRLTARYMNLAKPYIVLSFGKLAAAKNFESFELDEYIDYQNKVAERRGRGAYHWLNNILGISQIAAFNRNAGTSDDQEFVLIPCYHPEMLEHSGPLKDKAMRLITMVIGLVWDAVGRLIWLHQNLPVPHPRGYRSVICQRLDIYLKSKLSMGHAFGRSFERAKSEYVAALQNDEEARRMRNQSAVLAQPDKGILKAKINTNFVRAMADRREYVLHITESGKRDTGLRQGYRLRWTEEDDSQQVLEPIFLPDGVVDPNSKLPKKRFLAYTAFGLDIRDAAGASLGDRQPMPNMAGNSKTETLPIAGLVIMLQDQSNTEGFFDRWEEVTGSSIDEVIAENINISKNDGSFPTGDLYLPATFFASSGSKLGLPVLSTPNDVLSAKLMTTHVDAVKCRSPARPGDVLWLLDRFLTEMYPQGGKVDLCPASLHLPSVYNKIREFCLKRTYQDHPHWRTLAALVYLTEKGLYERHIPANYLLLGIEVLRQPFFSETIRRTGAKYGQLYEIDRPVLTIGTTRPAGVVAAIVNLPWIDGDTYKSDEVMSEPSGDEEDEEEEEE